MHTKAHAGHPWNECADCIAVAACQMRIPELQLPVGLRNGIFQQPRASQWMWLAGELNAAYPDVSKGVLQATKPTAPSAASAESHAYAKAESKRALKVEQQAVQKVHIKLATANVLTLHPAKKARRRLKELGLGLNTAARTEILQRQWHEHKFCVIYARNAFCSDARYCTRTSS